jgi:hypothetical protein
MPDDGNPIERRVMINLPLNVHEVYELNQLIPLEDNERVHWIKPVAVVDAHFENALQYTIVKRGETNRGDFYDVIYRMVERATISIGDTQGRVVINGSLPNHDMTFMVGITKQKED